jgi:response regulator RpfG family c-di-GMP phosphodiesterase
MPSAQAVAEIVKCAGTQFSPGIVAAFLQLYKQKEINGKVDIPRQEG